MDAMDLVLAGGEDHALLATFPSPQVPSMFRVIGRVITRGDYAVLVDGEPRPGKQGHDHFG